jgi:hypothetical protein
MLIHIDEKNFKFKPENNKDWFSLGRITKNMNCDVDINNSRLNSEIKNVSIPIKDVLEMLSDGKIIEDKHA